MQHELKHNGQFCISVEKFLKIMKGRNETGEELVRLNFGSVFHRWIKWRALVNCTDKKGKEYISISLIKKKYLNTLYPLLNDACALYLSIYDAFHP